MEKKRIEISLSKFKLIKLLTFSVMFLLGGIWIIVKQPSTSNFVFDEPILKNSAAIGSTIMGLIGIYFFTRKLFDKKPGLIIDENGITDNVTMFSFGFIPWSEVIKIEEVVVKSSFASKQKFVHLVLNNFDTHIARAKNKLQRKILSYNAKHTGSVLALSTNSLKIKHEELLSLLNDYFESA